MIDFFLQILIFPNFQGLLVNPENSIPGIDEDRLFLMTHNIQAAGILLAIEWWLFDLE